MPDPEFQLLTDVPLRVSDPRIQRLVDDFKYAFWRLVQEDVEEVFSSDIFKRIAEYALMAESVRSRKIDKYGKIKPMERGQFATAVRCLLFGGVEHKTNQEVANIMAACVFVQAKTFDAACARGWCNATDPKNPVITIPSWPVNVKRPEWFMIARGVSDA